MPQRVRDLLQGFDNAELETVIGDVIQFAGMVPLTRLTLQRPVAGVGWIECWERGLAQISRLGREAIDRERELG